MYTYIARSRKPVGFIVHVRLLRGRHSGYLCIASRSLCLYNYPYSDACMYHCSHVIIGSTFRSAPVISLKITIIICTWIFYIMDALTLGLGDSVDDFCNFSLLPDTSLVALYLTPAHGAHHFATVGTPS